MQIGIQDIVAYIVLLSARSSVDSQLPDTSKPFAAAADRHRSVAVEVAADLR